MNRKKLRRRTELALTLRYRHAFNRALEELAHRTQPEIWGAIINRSALRQLGDPLSRFAANHECTVLESGRVVVSD